MELLPCGTPRQWAVDGIPVLTARAVLPQWKGSGGGRFNRYYRAYARAFFHYCETDLLPEVTALFRGAVERGATLPMWQVTLETTVTLNTASYLSLYTQTVEVGGRRLVLRRSDTWDVRSGFPAPLRAFFPKRDARRQILSAFAEKIRHEESIGLSRYDPDWQQLLGRYYSADRFYLAQDGLHFFYQMYQLAPAVEGLPEVTLPYGDDIVIPTVSPTPDAPASPPAAP
jgi:hypothetical protein